MTDSPTEAAARAVQTPSAPPVAASDRIDRGAFGWALYEAARNPWVIVCIIYVFAPYVATTVIGDPVEGQAQIADLNKWSGLIAAFVAPILGAAADRAGGRKAPLAVVTAIMATAMVLCWFVAPGPTAWTWFPLLLVVSGLFGLNEALHNSMLPGATTPRLVPHVSGLGLALGNAAGLLILIFTLIFLAFPGHVDWSFIPAAPAFGLDPGAFEPQRIVPVICGVWFALLAIPLMLWTPDTERGEPWGQAIRNGLGSVIATLRKLNTLGSVGRFLVARMLYADAKTAILVIGGVYVAGVMKWGLIEMTIYGIVLSSLAVLGGFVGGWLDDAVGPKRAIMIEIAATCASLVGMVSIDRETMFFQPMAPVNVWDAPYFATLQELTLLGVVCVLAVFITAAYASSRTLMTRLSPPNMVGELFGLYALAGSATSWLGPLLVSAVTRATQSQQIGFASIAVLLVAGFVVLLGVRAPPRG
jgi:UMF1 family MFS transporter